MCACRCMVYCVYVHGLCMSVGMCEVCEWCTVDGNTKFMFVFILHNGFILQLLISSYHSLEYVAKLVDGYK